MPLLIALDWTGDDSSFLAGTGGFTPLPSAMALGATWTPELAEQVGAVMGKELHAAGASLLLGPTLDVLDVPRPGSKGDLDTRTFGGDPFWVGKLGQAFIRGVQTGSDGAVVTAAKHFPGQGGSDRRPEDEVATVQKSMEQLRQIELAPFGAVTAGGDPQGCGHDRRADDLAHPLPRLPGQHPPAHAAHQPGAAVAGPDGVTGVRRLAGGRRRAGQ